MVSTLIVIGAAVTLLAALLISRAILRPILIKHR